MLNGPSLIERKALGNLREVLKEQGSSTEWKKYIHDFFSEGFDFINCVQFKENVVDCSPFEFFQHIVTPKQKKPRNYSQE